MSSTDDLYAIEFESAPRLVGPFESRREAADAAEEIAARRGGTQAWHVAPIVPRERA